MSLFAHPEVSPAKSARSSSRSLIELLAVLSAGCAAVILFHRTTILSGFDIVQADVGDSRLIVFLLDHWKRVFAGMANWSSPAMFYPFDGALGYSDMLLGMAVPYAIFRTLGFGLFEAANATIVLLSFLSYVSCYWLLRRTIGLGSVASVIGSLFFAFGYPKFIQLSHLQLRFDFFQPLALSVIAPLWLESRRFGRTELAVRANAFVVLICLGFSTVFYHAWFFCFWLAIAALMTTAFPTLRTRIALHLRDGWPIVWQPILLGAVLLLPFFSIYLPGRITGTGRQWQTTVNYIPSVLSYLRVGSDNVLWGWTRFNLAPFNIEQRLGVGIIATLALIAGWGWSLMRIKGAFRSERNAPSESKTDFIAAILLSALVITVATIHWGPLYPWRLVYHLVPGTSAMLAVGRWTLTLLLPASILIAKVVDLEVRPARPRHFIAQIALGTVCLLLLAEQLGRVQSTYSSAVASQYHERIAAAIPPSCESFLLAPALVERMIPQELFDAAAYLAANSDVAQSWHGSAWEHYRSFGFREGRKGFALPRTSKTPTEPILIAREQFDANAYLAANPDVAQNWRGSAWEHYRQFGAREGRALSPDSAAKRQFDNFHYQLSALIAAAISGKPTVNGASGLLPTGYSVSNLFQPELEGQLEGWLRKFPGKRACLVRQALPPEDLVIVK